MVSNIAVTITGNRAAASAYLLVLISKDGDHRSLPRIVDLAQVQHVPLHYAPAGDPHALDNAPVAMLFAILPADFAAQEHDGRQLSAHWRR